MTEIFPAREMIAGQLGRLGLGEWRELILDRWAGKLSAEEERFVRTTADEDVLSLRFGVIQRVRFAVTEQLAGPRIVEVYTDMTSCGYRFESGLTYLVVAEQDGLRYHAGACSRTARVESEDAVEDLKALRAWRDGHRLPPRIYGHVSRADRRTDIRVRLFDDQGREQRLSGLDANGRFSFDDLARIRYRLRVEDSRGKGERLIDLSGIGCFEATPWFSESWRIAGAPVEMESTPEHRAPPAPARQGGIEAMRGAESPLPH